MSPRDKPFLDHFCLSLRNEKNKCFSILDLPKFDCETERDFANSERIKYNIIGAFIPSCEENGVAYKALQYNASSGERWCVDPVTGHEILLTRKKKGEPIPDCTNRKNIYIFFIYISIFMLYLVVLVKGQIVKSINP